jgi:hypothetical protein
MREIVGEERDSLILHVLERIEADTQRIAAPERTAAWERGWLEQLQRFRDAPHDDSLVPAFFRAGQPVRWRQGYWQPDDPEHELKHARRMQRTVLAEAFAGCASVHEFGAGTGFNLVALARLEPKRPYWGYDFSFPAVQLISDAGQMLGLPVRGAWFNMAKPVDMEFGPDAGVLTFGAVEQLGGSEAFKPFIEWLITKRPKIVLHVEPTVEFYDPANLIDNLAIRFHRKRGYTTGLLPYLQAHPQVEMLKAERGWFGSLMLEAYNTILWRVK